MGNILPLVLPLVPQIVDWVGKLIAPPRPPPPPPAAATPTPISRDEMIANARRALGMDALSHYNFGICGGSGAGKSSLINAVRGLQDVRPGEETAAETSPAGVDIVEATSKTKRYTFPEAKFSHIKLWDLPGGGTVTHKAHDYFHEKTLYAFDCLLMLTAERFTTLDNDIASMARKFNTPIAMVVNKGDLFLDTESKAMYNGREYVDLESEEEKAAVVAAVIAKKKADVRAKLPADAADVSVFVISSKQYSRQVRGLQPTAPVMEANQLVAFIVDAAVKRRAP